MNQPDTNSHGATPDFLKVAAPGLLLGRTKRWWVVVATVLTIVVLLALLDDAAVVALVLLVLSFLKIKIPLAVAIVIGLLFGSLVFITHKAIIPSLHKRKVTGSEGMIGLGGKVAQPLTPVGVVKVGSEYWQAKSTGEDIAAGEDIEVLGLDGLKLTVKRKGR